MSQLQGTMAIIAGLLFIIYSELKTQEFVGDFKDKSRLKRNIFYGIFSTVTMLTLSSLSVELRYTLPTFFKSSFVSQVFLAFVVGEFLNYVLHFFKHHFNFLWNFHFMHHQESHYNIWLTTHTHFGEVLFSGVLMTCIFVMLGIGTEALQVYYVFYALGNSYQHSSLTSKIGPLKYIIVTPSYHQLHHLKGSRINYGSTLTLFDLIFRTADFKTTQDKLAVGFGINDKKPFDFVEETFLFLEDLKKSESFARLLRLFSNKPIR